MVEKAFCINLDHRQDRLHLVMEQFTKHDLKVERIAAVDGRTGEYKNEKCDSYNNACTLSHMKVIEQAKAEGLKTIMILEDDVILHKYFVQLLEECMLDIPPGWDMLYLGGTHRKKPQLITSKIFRVVQTLTTHAYIIRSQMFDEVLKLFALQDRPVDCYYAELQKKYRCYVTNPVLAWQRAGYSDLCHRKMAYPWLKTNTQ